MTIPRAQLPTLRAFLGAIACAINTSTKGTLGLNTLDGALTETDLAVQSVVNDAISAIVQAHISVRLFGATGDGVTNDTVAVQAAVNAAKLVQNGAAVFFPAGKYLLDMIDITSAYPLTIYGIGAGSQLKGNGADTLLLAHNSAGPLVIRDLGFAGSVCRAIWVNGSTASLKITNCDIQAANKIPAANIPGCIVATNVNDVLIEANEFHNCGQVAPLTQRTYGVASDASTQVHRWQIRNNRITSSTLTLGLCLFDANESELSGNHVDLGVSSIYDPIGGDGHGLVVYNHGAAGAQIDVRVVNNHVANCGGNGIYIQNVQHVVVADNRVSSCAMVMLNNGSLLCAGIALAASPNSVCSANVINGGYRNGISYQGDDVCIACNTVRESGDVGIYCSGTSSRLSIIGNGVRTTFGRNAWVQSATNSATFSTIANLDTLTLAIDGGGAVVVTFAPNDTTGPKVAARVLARLNAVLGAGHVYVNCAEDVTLAGWVAGVPNSLVVQSTTQGSGSHVQIVGGSAGVLTKLGYTAHTVDGIPTDGFATVRNLLVSRCVFDGNTAYAAGGNGFTWQELQESTVSNNVADSNLGAGFQEIGDAALPSENNLFLGNQAQFNIGHGFDARGIYGVYRNCKSRGNHGLGFYDGGGSATAPRIEGCDLTGNNGASYQASVVDSNATLENNTHHTLGAVRKGKATLAAGTSGAIVNTEVQNNANVKSVIRLNRMTQGAGPGDMSYAIVDQTSFTITSSNGADTGDVWWEIIH